MFARAWSIESVCTLGTTALGTVSYQYDALGRRTQLDTPGQASVLYGYDAASRLTQVIQGSQAVGFQYDPSGRRTQLTLPNGVSTEYAYDLASRLTELTYRSTVGGLGNLTYQYDAAGNRTRVGGTFARTGLPEPIDATTYDAANRQLVFGDRTVTYDTNGNLTSITDPSGVTSLTWDVRNRLTTLTGPGLATSFQYDGLGRRTQRSVNGTATEFLYDGLNLIQEVAADHITSLLTGLGIHESFTRTEPAGTRGFLADALGSTVALSDEAGPVQTEYSY